MAKATTFIIGLLVWATTTFAQEPIDITDQTIKIGGLKEERF